eukprot:1093244-Pyramimonas_sp.AAC.1
MTTRALCLAVSFANSMQGANSVQIPYDAHSLQRTPAWTYLGCGAALPQWYCHVGAETFYVNCGRILSGSIDTKADQCAVRCSALSGYVAFSVHDTTACFCLKTTPTPADDTIAASSCTNAVA